MIKNIKVSILSFFFIILISIPQISFGQVLQPSVTTGTAASTANTNAASARLPYNPSSGTSGTRSFSGSSFNGVGGAIAGCANVGGLAVGGISSLFKNKTDKLGIVKEEIPVKDSTATKELKRANRTKECLDGVAYAAAKTLLQQVSNKTLTWINRGLGGNPFYVQDVASNLQGIRNEQLERYLNTVQTSNPIFGNAIRSAVTKQVTGISDGYLNKTMNTPEGKAYQAFQQDFTQGGWDALLNMNNNPIGAFFNSADRLAKNTAQEQENRVAEIQRNDGFLDMRECIEYEKIVLSDADICVANGTPVDEFPPGEECKGPVRKATSAKKPICLKYKTITPGQLISQQASQILGSPARQLEMADSINEVFGSFFNQILNNLFQNGLSSLRSNSRTSNNFRTSGNNIILGSNGLPITSTGGSNAFGYQQTGSGYDVEEFDISRPQQLRSIVQAQYDFLNRATDSQIAMRSIVPTLGALDYCIPGPNPTWQEGLSNNFDSFINSLDTPSKERSTFNKIVSSLPIIGGLFGSGDKQLDYILAGVPDLFDKATDQTISLSPWSYEHWTGDYDRPLRKSTDGGRIRGFIVDGYRSVINKYTQNFTENSLIALFGAVDPNTNFVKGFVKESLKESVKLTSYNNNLSPLDASYTQAISDSDEAIEELVDIQAEALAIVKVAKARYIRERSTSGNPVNMACLDQAYIINENPVKGVARKELDITNPLVEQSREASDYFYNNL